MTARLILRPIGQGHELVGIVGGPVMAYCRANQYHMARLRSVEPALWPHDPILALLAKAEARAYARLPESAQRAILNPEVTR